MFSFRNYFSMTGTGRKVLSVRQTGMAAAENRMAARNGVLPDRFAGGTNEDGPGYL